MNLYKMLDGTTFVRLKYTLAKQILKEHIEKTLKGLFLEKVMI